MAIGVDLSKRKPRQVRGTPTQKSRNRFAFAVVSVGTIVGIAWHYWSVSTPLQNVLREHTHYEPEGEIERKEMIASWLTPLRRPDTIKRWMKEEQSPALPYK